MKIGGKPSEIWNVGKTLYFAPAFSGKLTSTSWRNAQGYLPVARDATLKEQYKMNYDVLTDNLMSRQRNGKLKLHE